MQNKIYLTIATVFFTYFVQNAQASSKAYESKFRDALIAGDRTKVEEFLKKAKFNKFDFASLKMSDDLNLSRDRYTALGIAVKRGHATIVQDLIHYGVDKNQVVEIGVGTAVALAASLGKTTIVALLIGAKADLNKVSTRGDTSLNWAAWNGHFEAAKALIEAKADVNLADNMGTPPLLSAARTGKLNIVIALLEAKANVNYIDNSGFTALMLSNSGQHYRVSRQLLRAPDLDERGVLELLGGNGRAWDRKLADLYVERRNYELSLLKTVHHNAQCKPIDSALLAINRVFPEAILKIISDYTFDSLDL